jgi:hypothetical protein
VPLSFTLSSGTSLPTNEPAIVVCSGSSALATQLRPASVTNGSALFTIANGSAVSVSPGETLLTAGREASGQPVIGLIDDQGAGGTGQQLLTALGSNSNNWFALTGDTAALSPDGVISTAQVSGSSVPTTSEALHAWFSVKWVGLVILGFVVLGALILLSQRRRRRQVGRPSSPERG